jgi:hypothetical protein
MDTNIAALKTVLQGYVDQVTDALIKARAQIKLDQYIDAESAYSNITASAAASYSDVRGTVSKRIVDQAREERDILLQELQELLFRGGVEIQGESSLSYWSLGI